MKHVVFFFAALMLGVGTSLAEAPKNTVVSTMGYGYSNSFIFLENGITFAVYPDGEFDFYMDNQVQAGVRLGGTALTFNSGFNYNPFVQYDDYGAVIQVQHVPVYYDFYGRVNQIGSIRISYRNNRVFRLGGMRVFYTPLGYYDYHIGYINPFNRVYLYRPFHRYFIRPALGFCMVYPHPYRRYYQPVRYTYYRPYRNNVRRAYAHAGRTHRYQPRTERARVYRNDPRVAARESVRDNRSSRSGTAQHTRSTRNLSKSARPSGTLAARDRSVSRSTADRRVERTRTKQVARPGHPGVAKRTTGARLESRGNTRQEVRKSSRPALAGADKRITRDARSQNRPSKARSSQRTNRRSQVAGQGTDRKTGKAARRSPRQ